MALAVVVPRKEDLVCVLVLYNQKSNLRIMSNLIIYLLDLTIVIMITTENMVNTKARLSVFSCSYINAE